MVGFSVSECVCSCTVRMCLPRVFGAPSMGVPGTEPWRGSWECHFYPCIRPVYVVPSHSRYSTSHHKPVRRDGQITRVAYFGAVARIFPASTDGFHKSELGKYPTGFSNCHLWSIASEYNFPSSGRVVPGRVAIFAMCLLPRVLDSHLLNPGKRSEPSEALPRIRHLAES